VVHGKGCESLGCFLMTEGGCLCGLCGVSLIERVLLGRCPHVKWWPIGHHLPRVREPWVNVARYATKRC
jgi:hypothetical protein